MTDKQKRLLTNMMIGGAGLGVSAASAVTLWDLIRHSKNVDETASDDDVVYVNVPDDSIPQSSNRLPGTKASNLMDMLLPGASVLAGLGTGALTYKVLRGLVQSYKKQEQQKKLDQAQQMHVTLLGELGDPMKQASDERKPMSSGDKVVAGLGIIPLLTALASGVVTYNTLGRYFPAPGKSTKGIRPKRIVVRRVPRGTTDDTVPQDLGPGRLQSVELEENTEKPPQPEETPVDITAADLNMAKMLSMRNVEGLVKASGASLVSDFAMLMEAVKASRGPEIKALVLAGVPMQSIPSFVKGSAVRTMHPDIETFRETVLRAGVLKNAAYGPSMEYLAAAEFTELGRDFVSCANELDDQAALGICKFAAMLEQAWQEDELEAARRAGMTDEQLEAILLEAEAENAGEDLGILEDQPITDGGVSGTPGEIAGVA
jgi:hypothetical protein